MGDYGAAAGRPRILDFPGEYGIPAAFFIPGKTAERSPDIVAREYDVGHQIGSHGYAQVVLQPIRRRRATDARGGETNSTRSDHRYVLYGSETPSPHGNH